MYLALGHTDDKLPVVDLGVDPVKQRVLGQSPSALDATAWPLHHNILRTSTPLILSDHDGRFDKAFPALLCDAAALLSILVLAAQHYLQHTNMWKLELWDPAESHKR
jgi:hypothetical protein